MNRKLATAPLALVLSTGLLGPRPAAGAAAVVLHAANNGRDSVSCGSDVDPCRTINWTVGRAPDLAVILVHPGVYGDVNDDGALGGPGEETPAGGDVFTINKGVTVVSEAGPGSTMLRCPGPGTVALNAAGARLGRKSLGFTLINCTAQIGSNDTAVSGNIIISTVGAFGAGVDTNGNGNALIQHNRCVGHDTGIRVSGSTTVVSRNIVSGNLIGIEDTGAGTAISGNVVIGNAITGIWLNGSVSDVTLLGATVESNSVIGNGYLGTGGEGGILADVGQAVRINRNNIFGNDDPRDNCGITYGDAPVLNATNNFWGSPSGPGSDPADQLCGGGSVLTFRVAKREFRVVPLGLK